MAVAVKEAPEAPTSPQAIVRRWLREQIDGQDEINTDRLILKARRRFAGDTEFLDALIGYALPPMVTDQIRVLCHGKRNLSLGDTVVTRETLERQAVEKLHEWYETTGNGTRKQLLRMTRPELLFSASERERRATTELAWAGFERDLAQGLTGNETVQDKFTTEQVASLFATHFLREDDQP